MAHLPSRKKRRLSPPDDSGSTPKEGTSEAKPTPVDGYLANAARWNLEQDYENRPRKTKKKDKENTRLPIKTADGAIEQLQVPVVEGVTEVPADVEPEEEEAAEPVPTEPKKSSKQQIREAKEELARVASLINEDPEEHVGALKTMAEFAKSLNPTVKKLALASQSAVFKDIIPGYRIRPLDESGLAEKVSREVKRLRAFEQGLVSAYQAYVKDLAACAAAGRSRTSVDTASIATMAYSCASLLLLSVPHFNFRGDLIKILVDKLSGRKIDADYEKCRTTLEQLFRDDEDGKPSQEAVAMITKMLKGRDWNVDESVLNTFLHLRLLTEFSMKASQNSVDKRIDETDGKKIKHKKVFRTKKERKAAKELKAVEKEFQEADATVSHEERERMQAETLKLVFATYFRILKARSPSLMGAVLEGLAKYAHLINQDFFGDLLVALQEISAQAVAEMNISDMSDDGDSDDESASSRRNRSNPHRTALLCTTTAFALLSSQDAASLNLDLSYFTNLLHTLLLPLSITPDLELSHKTLRLADPHVQADSSLAATNKVNATALSTLLVRALASSLTPRNTPPTRLAAFVHRLMLFSLHAPEKSSLAVTALLKELTRTQGRKVRGLWDTEERRGDGAFEPLGGIEQGRPFCGTVWEGELLRLHFSEGVRAELGELERIVKGLA